MNLRLHPENPRFSSLRIYTSPSTRTYSPIDVVKIAPNEGQDNEVYLNDELVGTDEDARQLTKDFRKAQILGEVNYDRHEEQLLNRFFQLLGNIIPYWVPLPNTYKPPGEFDLEAIQQVMGDYKDRIKYVIRKVLSSEAHQNARERAIKAIDQYQEPPYNMVFIREPHSWEVPNTELVPL